MRKNNFIEKNKILGIAAASGIHIGKAFVYSKEKLEISHSEIVDVEDAKKNLLEALERSKYELTNILKIATEKMGEKRSQIFEAQIMILDDPILLDKIFGRIIKEKKLPESIVFDEMTRYQNIMSASDEPYMQERAHDIEDIKNRIIRNLQKKRIKSKIITEDVIVVSPNLTPADTILFARNNVRGYVTDHGGLTSHAAIIARSLNIPAVVGTRGATNEINTGDDIIVDGFHGYVIIKPTEKQLKYYRSKIKILEKLNSELSELKDKPAVTKDGKEIIIRGNIDVPEELEFLKTNGGKGVGLLRTEQVFDIISGVFPPEEEQTKFYRMIAEYCRPEYIVIRAFDIGGDKVLPHDIKEANPFLGWRGIRFLLDNEKIFKTQIRAVLRASNENKIKFMIPMVSSLLEIRRTKELLEICKEELKQENIPHSDVKLGIMIEVPAAFIMAGEFAREVDFLSIGTNDLIQYIMAVDRGNENVSSLYQEFNPAVLRALATIIKKGKEEDAFVSMCGEMAADSFAIPLLVGLGLDSISVSPATIPYIKRIIMNITFSSAWELASECLTFSTETEVVNKIKDYFAEHFPGMTEI